jgi:hypothetical protein
VLLTWTCTRFAIWPVLSVSQRRSGMNLLSPSTMNLYR